MKVTIEIIEDYQNNHYLINGKEWVYWVGDEEVDVNDQKVIDNICFANKVCKQLINEAVSQNNIPQWVADYFYDGQYDTYCSHSTFVKLVRHNKNTVRDSSGLYTDKVILNIEI